MEGRGVEGVMRGHGEFQRLRSGGVGEIFSWDEWEAKS